MLVLLRYVHKVKPGFYYYRRSGRYWGRISGEPGTVEFAKSYAAIHKGFGAPPKAEIAMPGSFAHLAESYLASGEYLQNLKPKTRAAYRYDLDLLKKALGPEMVADIDHALMLQVRDTFSDRPGTANTLMRTARAVFAWGMPRRLATSNPADLSAINVKALKIGEHKPWPLDALDLFRARARPHLVLAMELGLWTGQRQGDLVRMRWGDIRDGLLSLTQEKTGKEMLLPIVNPLRRILDAAPKSAVTVLVNSRGMSWAKANPLAQAFADELASLGLSDLVFHGLRKTSAVALAEAGCSTKEIAAITGQSDQMVIHYTKGTDRIHLARQAIVKLENHMNSVTTRSGKPQKT